jgi:hypothetical protein
MRLWVFLLALAADPSWALAQTDCSRLGRDPIDMVLFESNNAIAILDQKGDVLTYREAIPGSDILADSAVQAANFPLSFHWGDQERVMTWQGPLPGLADLSAGRRFQATAKIAENGKPVGTMTVTVEVVGNTDITIRDCTYPVVEMLVTHETDSGPGPVVVRKWLHLPSLIVLGSDVQQNGKVTENRVSQMIYRAD